MRKQRLTPAEVRRIALGAQGFSTAAPANGVERQHLRRTLARTGLLQIDSVNVVARAHLMPLYARLGPYPVELLERAQSRKPRMLFEYWAHEASLLPVETQPLMRWRMERAARGQGVYKGLVRFAREEHAFIEHVYERVADEGPIASSAFGGDRGDGGWWGWSKTKKALEWLFWCGRITTHSRRPSFERLYDLPGRVLPQSVLDTPTPREDDAQRALVEIAARALGVATEPDLRDYFRLKPADSQARVAELVEAGALLPVEITGWRNTAYLHRDAKLPRRIDRPALLSPFDPVVWERDRAERIFGFRYRIEIYTPAHKRVHGYYVLPFLMRDRIVARVDLKADRARRTLLVQAAHAEPHAPAETAEALSCELQRFANWLELESVSIMERGDLASALIAYKKAT
ncbi:crosslink repair DNA glycosylase YcaQ family protein [uncultured Nitratireductor sp.]|uniref:winged helix-turn-helix domain-containing protein n=1 Tax=uncultured Nitratireductor sp. TaxID=520953 RepID=UPI0026029120|nr:crosslink repair DNA glycosylase YcaQ family protein [uncultured Nitratireductor sp.]